MKRPWGNWWVIYKSLHFKIKILRFKKGGAISMQRHFYRSELWLFLKGQGKMQVENEDGMQTQLLYKGSVAQIPLQRLHKFTSFKPTWILEVQYGSHCYEADIERKDA